MLMNKNEKISIYNIKNAIESMKPFFEVIRLVDAKNTCIITFDDELNIIRQPKTCYKVWNKAERCENCTSIKASLECCPKIKYEMLEGVIYQVLSRPVILEEQNGDETPVVLEIITRAADEVLLRHVEKKKLSDKEISAFIAETYRKVYEDPLTTVYNRRFLDEFKYLYHRNDTVATNVTFIMGDLKKFKEINDTMGHDIGDQVLAEVASILKINIRRYDSIIRLGGDEFLIVLINCPEHLIETKIHILRDEVNKICYDHDNKKYVDIDFGYAHTDDFEITKEFADSLIKQADIAMYEVKKNLK